MDCYNTTDTYNTTTDTYLNTTTDTYNITTKILWKYYSHLHVYRPAVSTCHYNVTTVTTVTTGFVGKSQSLLMWSLLDSCKQMFKHNKTQIRPKSNENYQLVLIKDEKKEMNLRPRCIIWQGWTPQPYLTVRRRRHTVAVPLP